LQSSADNGHRQRGALFLFLSITAAVLPENGGMKSRLADGKGSCFLILRGIWQGFRLTGFLKPPFSAPVGFYLAI
jgi:hypothetical protein